MHADPGAAPVARAAAVLPAATPVSSVAAVVVAYHPELDVIADLLAALRPQVGLLIVVDNSNDGVVAAAPGVARWPDEIIDLGGNRGLGAALNAGFARAAAAGITFVATFDQDSAPPPSLIAGLLAAHAAIARDDPRCAAVGPAFFDRRERGRHPRFPFYREQDGVVLAIVPQPGAGGVVQVDTLITSGMLVRVAAWQEDGHYDARLFVDYTDTEWCFRQRARGWHLYGCLDVPMGHALSDAPPVRVGRLSFFRYSPWRRYCYFRNTRWFCNQPCVSPAWRRRLLRGLALRFLVNLLIDDDRGQSWRMMRAGLRDGAGAVLGPLPAGEAQAGRGHAA